jgi:hypothetical protein
VTLPEGISGELTWGAQSVALRPGQQAIECHNRRKE